MQLLLTVVTYVLNFNFEKKNDEHDLIVLTEFAQRYHFFYFLFYMSFYISKHHVLQIFRTWFNLIWKIYFHHEFPSLMG